jgi:hypothetical protein
MPWFSAHIIIGFVRKSTEKIVVWENVVLIEAEDHENALEKASIIGKSEASLKDGMRIDGELVERVFAGVRKIGTIYNHEGPMNDVPPSDKCEITHSEYLVENKRELNMIGNGEEIKLIYIE